MISENRIRNHPSVIVEQTLFLLIILFFIFMSLASNVDSKYTTYLFILLAIAPVVAYVVWRKTYIIFRQDELVIERNLLIKSKKTIPYDKIASVNIERKILNRVFKTSALKISINSGVNSMVPEASLTFKEDIALRIRSELSNRLFSHTYDPKDDEAVKSVVDFSAAHVLLHSIFGMPTIQSIAALFFAFTSLISFFNDSSGLFISLLIFALIEIVPVFFSILKFYNFKVYRKDDAIHLQHGMIQTYRFSFNISRVNAVRIRRPLLARVVLHQALIEAEVVGLSDSDGKTPTICLLIDESKIPAILDALLPEYVYDHNLIRQPPAAVPALLANASIYSIVSVAVLSVIWYLAEDYALFAEYSQVAFYALLLFMAGLVLINFVAARILYKVVEFDMGKDHFTFVNNVVDRETVIISYDRVQIVNLASGPVARKMGLARCAVSLLSSQGSMNIRSGYFPVADVSKIAERILERIALREYDWLSSGI